ncbi:aspartyl/asparaginyl beta-hydroxylase domain-containing protein [Nocardia sp. NPDC047038]|uniref:aspartyl/asparaginyl beta-hydroxylase domain-containing protein n=1 Tax=Nocardia sp. NPDC047038 TaxID=3154338 RepID=UPI0033E2AA61
MDDRQSAGLRLARLLLGHLTRYRDARLQDAATRALRDERDEWIVSTVNASLRARRRAHHLLRLEPRRLGSRLRHPWRPDAGAGPTRSLSLLCPTRERVDNVSGFLDSVCRTAAAPGRIEALFYVDDDDPQLDAYRELFARSRVRFGALGRCDLVVGPPIGVPAAWNRLARASTGDLLMMANDDQAYVDYAWDQILDSRAAHLARLYPDEVWCLYFDAGQYLDGSCDFPILSRTWYETVGYFTPEIFRQWEVEIWLFDIAERVGRLFPVPGVFVEHLHYQDYKAPFDATYQRHRLTRDTSFADHALFLRTRDQRAAEVRRLRRVITGDGSAAASEIASPELWFGAELSGGHARLRAEAERLDAQAERTAGPKAGGWRRIPLFASGAWTETALRMCPATVATVSAIPEALLLPDSTVELAILPPGPCRAGDSGASGTRVEFGLQVPEGAGMRVDAATVSWRAGECVAFDAGAARVAWNDSAQPLMVLTFVVPRPERSTTGGELVS